MTRDEAVKAARIGAWAAFISAGLATILLMVALTTNAQQGVLGVLNDPWNILDIAVAVACGFGMLRKSRVAAITMLLLFVLGKIVLAIETGRMTGVVLSLVFLYFFARAVQGTFVFHSIERTENADYRSSPRWMYWVGIPAFGSVAILLVFGLMIESGWFASTKVLSGTELSKNQHEILVSSEIISNDETVEYFYSEALFSIAAAGNVLTNRRVVSYETDESGELQIYSLPISNIASVELLEQGGFLSDSVYLVNGLDDGQGFLVVLSREEGGDEKFINALKAKVWRQDDTRRDRKPALILFRL